jgi:hypothetical protein
MTILVILCICLIKLLLILKEIFKFEFLSFRILVNLLGIIQ